MLAFISIDNSSGSSLKGGVLGVALAGASARTHGTGSPGVLSSSSIDNTSGSLSEAFDGDFEEEKAGRRNGATVALGGEFAGPDGTGAGEVVTTSTLSPRKKPRKKRGRRGGRSKAQRAHDSKK